MKKHLHWTLPLIFTVWTAVSILLLLSIGANLPNSAAPVLAQIVFIPFMPFLPAMRFLGLAMSIDAYSGPTPWGFIIGTLVYDFILFGAAKCIQSIGNKSKT